MRYATPLHSEAFSDRRHEATAHSIRHRLQFGKVGFLCTRCYVTAAGVEALVRGAKFLAIGDAFIRVLGFRPRAVFREIWRQHGIDA
jgi:hypothetical protein